MPLKDIELDQHCPVIFIWGQFHKRYSSHQSLKLALKLPKISFKSMLWCSQLLYHQVFCDLRLITPIVRHPLDHVHDVVFQFYFQTFDFLKRCSSRNILVSLIIVCSKKMYKRVIFMCVDISLNASVWENVLLDYKEMKNICLSPILVMFCHPPIMIFTRKRLFSQLLCK